MKLAAAHAIADSIDPGDLGADYIIPSVFDSSVARNVARAVKKAAIASGVSRRQS
jgi:malate dehydrogenase (oxaloacetate-decarboxylating)